MEQHKLWTQNWNCNRKGDNEDHEIEREEIETILKKIKNGTLYDCLRSITSFKTICYLLYCCIPQLSPILIAYNIVLYYYILYTHNWLINCIIYKYVCNLFRFTITLLWIFLFTLESMKFVFIPCYSLFLSMTISISYRLFNLVWFNWMHNKSINQSRSFDHASPTTMSK